jgi:hypothetical protein
VWQVEQEVNECFACRPVAGGVAWQVVQDCTGGVYVQDCVSTGLPPVQDAGDEPVTVRDCVPFDWHAPHAE